MKLSKCCFFFFSSRRRHTRCALVTGVQTCALPISRTPELRASLPVPGSDAGQLQRDEENGKMVATLLCLLSFSSLHCCSWRHVHRCKSWCARESRQEGIRDDQGTEIRAIGTHSRRVPIRSEEHTSELQSLMRISYA